MLIAAVVFGLFYLIFKHALGELGSINTPLFHHSCSFVGNTEIDVDIKKYYCRAGIKSIQVSFQRGSGCLYFSWESRRIPKNE